MSRRRLTLAHFVRRRWRVVGAIVVLLLGALLVLAVTDRGHDPVWRAPAEVLEEAAFAPDGTAAYALLREGENVTRVVSLDGATGERMWDGRLPENITSALVAAGPGGVAVATDFPNAFLTVYAKDGAVRWQVALEGNPIALAWDDDHVALALNAPHNPVLVFETDYLLRTFRHAARVNALDLASGVVAVGTADGTVVARGTDGVELANVTLDLAPASLRLAGDGTALVVAGSSLGAGSPGGRIAFLDVGAGDPLRWESETPAGIGLVGIDEAGLVALAVEESPPSAVLHVFEGATGATRWTRLVPGIVSHDRAGSRGAAVLSPDARFVAVGTLRGTLELFDAQTGDEAWSFRAGGVKTLAFADDEAKRLIAGGRLLANRPFDSVLLFSVTGEPAVQSMALIASVLVALATTTLALFVGVGFWRARKTY